MDKTGSNAAKEKEGNVDKKVGLAVKKSCYNVWEKIKDRSGSYVR